MFDPDPFNLYNQASFIAPFKSTVCTLDLIATYLLYNAPVVNENRGCLVHIGMQTHVECIGLKCHCDK